MDGNRFNQRRPPYVQQIRTRPQKLNFPPGYPSPDDRYEPSTAIRQLSAGRAHVLGLSDSGRIWSWDDIGQPGLTVQLLNVELGREGPRTSRVKKVVAGWAHSAALVRGAGIVVWAPLSLDDDDTTLQDAALVLEVAVVPRTLCERMKTGGARGGPAATDLKLVGEVLNFILLENFIVFNTHLGHVFAAQIRFSPGQAETSDIFEIPLISDTSTPRSSSASIRFATDVSGSFRNLAIFTRDGAVLTCSQDHLHRVMQGSSGEAGSALTSIPALQNAGVISVAFGDYHFHALHASGYITSYGCESQRCGSLGLGGHGDPEGRIRGLRYAGIGGDGRLVPHAYTTGRMVWFEKEKRDWIRFLVSGGKDPEEARERLRMCAETSVQGEVSEWVEQEGRAWSTRFSIRAELSDDTEQPVDSKNLKPQKTDTAVQETDDDDGLAPYFALSVTAAGWHSGALVLVNDALVTRIKESCIIRMRKQRKRSASSDKARKARPGLISQALTAIDSWTRWFLGYPFADDHSSASTGDDTRQGREPQRPSNFTDPVNHGAAPDSLSKYAWAEDSFPRLRLRDGREMPGTIDFTEWRHGRPEWDLAFQGP